MARLIIHRQGNHSLRPTAGKFHIRARGLPNLEHLVSGFVNFLPAAEKRIVEPLVQHLTHMKAKRGGGIRKKQRFHY